MRMLCLTNLCIDKYPELSLEVMGGNSLNIAAALVSLGEEQVALLGAVGSDNLGDRVMNYLKHSKIQHSHVYQIPGITAHNHFYRSGDSELFYEDGWVNGVFGEYRLNHSDWEYLELFDLFATTFWDPNFPAIFKGFHKEKKLAIDFLNSKDTEKIKEIMPNAYLGFASGNQQMAESLIAFSKTIENPLVVTAGAEGSYCLYKGELFFEPPVTVTEKVDSIGCGDAYQAGFIVSWTKEPNIQRAMKAGTMAASKILQCVGGVIDGAI